MRQSRRIKRMSRNRLKITKMNLTSLMDVFTILVFFLLVNSGSVEVLDAPKEVQLPESKVETKPRETVVIFVSPEEVLVQGQPAAVVDEILAAEEGATDQITAKLAELKENVVGPSTLAVAASTSCSTPWTASAAPTRSRSLRPRTAWTFSTRPCSAPAESTAKLSSRCPTRRPARAF